MQAEANVAGVRALAAVPLALFFLPTWANLMLGQPAPAVAFLAALSVWLSQHRSPQRPTPSGQFDFGLRTWDFRPAFWSGAALAAALCIKPHLLALLAPLWLGYHVLRWRRGERRSALVLAGVASAGALLAGVSFWLLPLWPTDFARAAWAYVAVGPGGSAALVTAQIVLPVEPARLVAAALTVVVVGWVLQSWRIALGGDVASELNAIWRTLLATALVVPPAWETNGVMLLLPLAAALAGLRSRRAAVVFAALSGAITIVLLPPYFVLGWQRGTLVIAAYLALLAGAAWLPSVRLPRPPLVARQWS
jgi:hypothetical protein